jgi:hypothetical protein
VTPGDVLRKARQLIVERGWCQGQPEDVDGRLCAIGAINLAAGMRPREGSPAAWDARWFLQCVIGTENGVTPWNDHPHRRAGDVLKAIETAAALADARAK